MMIKMSETETCPYCGGEYKRLATHLPYCKMNPANIEKIEFEDSKEYIDNGSEEEIYYTTVDEVQRYNYTASDSYLDVVILEETEPTPEPETPQPKPCPYLVIIAGNACASCRGVSCMASKDKKISDTDYCKYWWTDCLAYEAGRDAGVQPICPYFGFPPADKPNCCSGIYCYARDSGVRVVKKCYHWLECGRFLQAKSEGKPYHRSKLI